MLHELMVLLVNEVPKGNSTVLQYLSSQSLPAQPAESMPGLLGKQVKK